ncbi:MAG: hypothetical protein ACD_21C00202G0002 [uncultured bacterium]|nr:MAG: hypothetical protein ACD_21C00202G0002 [uncultured bacterium]
MINKFKCILLISIGVIAFVSFESAFAVRVSSIREISESDTKGPIPTEYLTPDEYQRLLKCFSDIDAIVEQLKQKKDEDPEKKKAEPVVLKVGFNYMPQYAIFLSGQYAYPVGGICPSSIFEEDAYERILSDNKFPFDRFSTAYLLEEGVEEIKRGVVSSLTSLILTVGEQYKEVQKHSNTAKSCSNNPGQLQKSLTMLDKALSAAHQQAREYLSGYVSKVLPLEQLHLYAHEQGYTKEKLSVTSFKSIDDVIYAMSAIRKDQYLASSLEPLILSYDAQIQPLQTVKFSTLFCRHCGRHAEDALIYEILRNLEKYDEIPEVIEIYGNKDPCFQCQIKLQWLADNLAGMIESARSDGLPQLIISTKVSAEGKEEIVKLPLTADNKGKRVKLEIVYYSKNAFKGPCFVDLSKLDMKAPESKEFVTRTESERSETLEENPILKFKFTEGAKTQPSIKEDSKDSQLPTTEVTSPPTQEGDENQQPSLKRQKSSSKLAADGEDSQPSSQDIFCGSSWGKNRPSEKEAEPLISAVIP